MILAPWIAALNYGSHDARTTATKHQPATYNVLLYLPPIGTGRRK
jgi:hypothetical protein